MHSIRKHSRWIGVQHRAHPIICSLFLLFVFVAGVIFTYGIQSAEAVSLPTRVTLSICGDAVVNAGEVCDDGAGNNTGGYGSSTAERICSSDCLSFGPYCGDSVLQARFDEECDDGNNSSGDLCAAQCTAEEPPPSGGGGTTRGSVPAVSGAPQGNIPSQTETKVVLRGKASPGAEVNILLDGDAIGNVQADASADFFFTTSDITPGTATFGFWTTDISGTESITTSLIFEVVQSAVTTLANVLIPPTLTADERQVNPGDLLTLSGYTIPSANVFVDIDTGGATRFSSETDNAGAWALQLDTASLSQGFHTAKALFESPEGLESGFGRSISFFVGDELPEGSESADLSNDGRINLIDFSIFLVSWGSDDIRADFNQDGVVSLADFSVLLFNWTG